MYCGSVLNNRHDAGRVALAVLRCGEFSRAFSHGPRGRGPSLVLRTSMGGRGSGLAARCDLHCGLDARCIGAGTLGVAGLVFHEPSHTDREAAVPPWKWRYH